MPERRYTDDEVAEIFARASEAERSAQSSPHVLRTSEGLTLHQLQAIGREAGIAPELVAHAANALDKPAPRTPARFLGLPLGVAHTVRLQRRLTDEEWERLVVDLRETFDARGVMRTDGAFRQWSNGNLQVMVEPDGDGQRIRFRTVKGDARALMMAGLGMMGTAAAVSVAALLTSAVGVTEAAGSLGPLGLIGAVSFGLGALRLPGWAKRRKQQMGEIGERLESLPAAD